jgi:glucose-1-phosphate cytidylyltransferase
MQKYIGNEPFLLTYGDGLSDVNLDNLIKFHNSHGKMITMTSVRPATRFGELELDKGKVVSFEEKPQLHEGWINGGYFVVEAKFMDWISGDEIMLEREPLVKAAKKGELMSFSHEGFWQCMDTKRDLDLLNKLWTAGDAPWKK